MPGAHSVPRAELIALVWAVEAAPDGLEARSDCQYVVRGARRLQEGAAGVLMEGRHGDLWQPVRVRWVPSHRKLLEVPASKIVHVLANDVADTLAKPAARQQRVNSHERAARRAIQADLQAAHTLVARALCASMEAVRGFQRWIHGLEPSSLRRGANLPTPGATAPRRPCAPSGTPMGPPSPGLCAGPEKANSLGATCRRCRTRANGTGQWLKRLGHCEPTKALGRTCHQVVRIQGGHGCVRCWCLRRKY